MVGLGSWVTFNVGDDPVARDACAEVMRAFFETGGRLIDCSPMYGSSQAVIGYGLRAYPSRQFGDQPPPMTGGSEEDENEAAGPRRWMAAAG